MKKNSIISLSVLLSLLGSLFSVHAQPDMSAADLKTTMRKLWTDHGVWTHEFIVAFFEDNLESARKLTLDRLLKNQEDIGNAAALFYGQDAGNKLTALLKDHIKISGDVLKAAKQGNKIALKVADDRWHNNAKDLAKFLSDANPNWTYDDLVNMLNEHLKLTTEEAVAWQKHDWRSEIELYDKVRDQLLHMADGLTDGIVKQFELE